MSSIGVREGRTLLSFGLTARVVASLMSRGLYHWPRLFPCGRGGQGSTLRGGGTRASRGASFRNEIKIRVSEDPRCEPRVRVVRGDLTQGCGPEMGGSVGGAGLRSAKRVGGLGWGWVKGGKVGENGQWEGGSCVRRGAVVTKRGGVWIGVTIGLGGAGGGEGDKGWKVVDGPRPRLHCTGGCGEW